MALTETRPDTASDDQPATITSPDSLAETAGSTGLAGVLGSGDHKVIGRLWIGASLLFLLVVGLLGELLAVERVDPDDLGLFSDATFLQSVSLHSVGTVFLFLLPLLVGLATVVVPLQVGARTVAFPRAAAAAFWTWLLAGLLVVAAYAINGGPHGADDDGVSLFLIALGAALVGLLLGMICVVTTVLAVRAPGLRLERLPLFAWSVMVAGVMWLLTLPVLLGGLVLLYLDHRYGQVFLGGADGISERIAWSFSQPQVYALAVPALGIVGDVVPVMAGRPSRLHTATMGAIAAFGALGFGAYAQRAFAPDVATQPLFLLASLGALVALLAAVGTFADTLRAGRPRLTSPLLYAVAALFMLLVGAAAGLLTGVERLELVDSTWTTAQVHYVLLATAIAALGGVQYWSTKVLGRPMGEGLGRVAAVLLLLGTIGLAFPDLVSGLVGDGDDAVLGIGALNALSALGGAAVLLGLLVFLAALVGARKGPVGVGDPWEGQTLEWLTD
ncbi:hypothetical protein BH24ACT3_BH24ACT3_02200 [soil metagenome]